RRCDEALGHVGEARVLAEQINNGWLASISLVWRGVLELMRDRLDDGRTILDEALDASVATHSADTGALALVGFARAALMGGDAERAALLIGAAEGLRHRVGLRVWPPLRRGEAELVEQVRQALGTDRFDQAFAAGSRLQQREAIAAVRDGRGMPR